MSRHRGGSVPVRYQWQVERRARRTRTGNASEWAKGGEKFEPPGKEHPVGKTQSLGRSSDERAVTEVEEPGLGISAAEDVVESARCAGGFEADVSPADDEEGM